MDQTYADMLMTYMDSNNGTLGADFRKPYIRPALRYVYPLFILIHAFIIIIGTSGNVAVLVVVSRRRLYHDPMYFFLGNLALSDIFKSCIVLPVTLANLLIQNWVFGSFLCYSLPMMHSFPIHASILTYMMIAVDRYRFIVHPMRSRVPAGLCTIAVWVVAVCVVLPYAVYIKYNDLGQLFGPAFNGVGVCWVNQERHIEEYLRAMFVVLYCLPLAVIAFLYIRVSVELKAFEGSATVSMHIDENIQSLSEASYQSRITWSVGLPDNRIDPEGASNESNHGRTYERFAPSSEADGDLDLRKEKRTQKYMISMVTLFAICWCPVNILVLVTHFVWENNDNTGHFDITYLTFIFIGYLSTCINPILFASWRMSDSTRDRLKGYFRFSNRRRDSNHSDISRTQDTFPDSFTNGMSSTTQQKSYV